jgi:hypothetical protein
MKLIDQDQNKLCSRRPSLAVSWWLLLFAVAADEEPKQQYLVVARRSLPETMSSWKSQEGENKGKEETNRALLDGER